MHDMSNILDDDSICYHGPQSHPFLYGNSIHHQGPQSHHVLVGDSIHHHDHRVTMLKVGHAG